MPVGVHRFFRDLGVELRTVMADVVQVLAELRSGKPGSDLDDVDVPHPLPGGDRA